jgi:sialidase-1
MKRIPALLFCILLLGAGCKKTENNPPEENPTFADTATFFEVQLYAPGDYGSANWRIPAILCLDDGSLLAVCDKRKYNESDLPEDIDIVARRSTDGGHTWSEPVTIAEGTGRKQGYGDAALVQCENGDVVCAFVGGNGLFASTEGDPQRSYICRSSDRGQTWSQPEDITALLWGSQANSSFRRDYRSSFFGSGNGLRLTRGSHKGRIMFAAAMCRATGNTLDNFVVFSDDNGMTWDVSYRAYKGGDEAKLMELTDGRLLISVRQSGARGYNISSDGGIHWGQQSNWDELTANACNGDMLRVMATDQGDSINLLLHSLPNSMQRENVSLFASRDEGESWQHIQTLFEGPSVYSSLTLMPNRCVGVLLEKNPNGACEIWFQQWPIRELVSY